MREVDRPLEPGQVADVLRDGAGEVVVGQIEVLQRRQAPGKPLRQRAGEVVPAEREGAEAAASQDRGRERAVEGVGGEVEDLEVGEVTELRRDRPVQLVPVQHDALQPRRGGEERRGELAEEAVAAEVEVAERGRERRRREGAHEALPREGQRHDAAVGSPGPGPGAAGDAVPGAGVGGGGGVPVGERASGSCSTAALKASSACPSAASPPAAAGSASRSSRRSTIRSRTYSPRPRVGRRLVRHSEEKGEKREASVLFWRNPGLGVEAWKEEGVEA